MTKVSHGMFDYDNLLAGMTDGPFLQQASPPHGESRGRLISAHHQAFEEQS